MVNDLKDIKKFDPELAKALTGELGKQRNTVNLIASENIVSKAVLEASASVMTNKYSEGYPGRRYYGGNRFIDISENLAIERAKKLFDAKHANVQVHSGTQANMAAYLALMDVGDKILSMNLAHGGHLTHGSPVSFSGKWYKISHYGVDKQTGTIDMDGVRKTALKEKPKLIIVGASAYPRKIDFKSFKDIADEAGAFLMADVAHIAGLIVSGLHQNSVPYADVTTTTTHKTLRGPRGALILCNEKHANAVDKAVFPGMQGGPMEQAIAAKAVAFKEALQPEFKEYSKQVIRNAKALAETLMEKGFKLVSDGTDNHLVLIDLTNKKVTGKEAEEALEKANIIVNKNMVPFDQRSPFDPSGIRIGTPATTSRGFRENEMQIIGKAISDVIDNRGSSRAIEKTRKSMAGLCREFPIYAGLKY